MNTDETPSKRYCRNCHFPLPVTAKYCPQCSQKYTTGKITVFQLFKDLFNNLFNLDSKLFLSIAALFVPAKLTLEYFKGRHKRYANPFRIFLVVTLLVVTFISFGLSNKKMKVHSLTGAQKILQKQAYLYELDSVGQQLKTEMNNPKIQVLLDSLHLRMSPKGKVDSTDLVSMFYLSTIFADTVQFLELNIEDLLSSPEAVCEKYEVTHFADKLMVNQWIKLFGREDISSYFQYLLGNIIWMLLLLLPTMALFLKLLYIRRKHYYVEHLVFLLHVHTFLIITYGLLFLLINTLPDKGIITSIILLNSLALIYCYKAMRRYYQQNRKRTIAKFILFNFVYFYAFLFFLLLISFISFLIY